jgi:hypothetical protein
VTLAGVHGTAREHPGAAHEALLRVALDEQDLEPLGGAAQEQDRRRLPRRDGLPGVELRAGLEAQRDQSS